MEVAGKVNNLDELLNLFKKKNININDYYYRGESRKFDYIIASLYRHKNIEHINPLAFFKDLINEYYREVATQIGTVEKENFLSFAQHHGLPTNLLDITTAPLVASYFATEQIESQIDESGYLYLFHYNNTILIDEQIKGKSIKSFFSNLITNDSETIKTLYEEFYYYLENNSKNFFESFFDIVDVILSEQPHSDYLLKNNIKKEIADIINIFNEQINREDILSSLKNNIYFNGVTIKKSTYDFLLFDKNITNTKIYDFYLIIYSTLFPNVESQTDVYNYNHVIWYMALLKYSLLYKKTIANTPIIIYQPTINFDRMKTQDGLFIYQESLENANNLKFQPINPDLVIEITNKEQLRKDIDNLGFNGLKLFHDPDNIAKYIKNKYF